MSLEEEIRNCNQCDLRSGCCGPVVGRGPKDARIWFVGEAPGKQEDEEGKPFIGASGKLLRAAILHIGLKPEDVYITNVVKCRPPGNRDPKKGEVEACNIWLRGELKIGRPEIVVTLGEFATDMMLGRSAWITGVRGKSEIKNYVIDDLEYEVTVFPLLHPAWILRGNREENKAVYRKDLKSLEVVLRRMKLVEEKKKR